MILTSGLTTAMTDFKKHLPNLNSPVSILEVLAIEPTKGDMLLSLKVSE